MNSEYEPHYAFEHLVADDVEVLESVRNQENWDCKYRQLSPGTYHGQVTTAAYNEILVFNERHNQSVLITGTTPVESYQIGLSLNQPARRFQGKKCAVSDLLVLGPDVTFDAVFDKSVEISYLQLSQGRLSALCLATDIDVGKLNQGLVPSDPRGIQCLKQAMQLALEPISSTDPAVLRERSMTTEQKLLHALIDVLSTNDPSQIRQPTRCKRSSQTAALARRIQEQLESSLDKPLQMLDLCEYLHCKLRTLHSVFTSYFGEPPSVYHKKIRMNAARHDLLNADPDATTVTNVATWYGFWHLGRFALNYKQLFGESPSQTLARTKPRCTYSFTRRSADLVSRPYFDG